MGQRRSVKLTTRVHVNGHGTECHQDKSPRNIVSPNIVHVFWSSIFALDGHDGSIFQFKGRGEVDRLPKFDRDMDDTANRNVKPKTK